MTIQKKMSTTPRTTLHPVDYVVLGVVLCISLAIGLYHAFSGGRQKTTKEYLMADRKLKTLPVALSLFMSNISAIYVLGTSAEIYRHGTKFWLSVIGNCIAVIIIVRVFVPLFHPLKLISGFQYVDMRFNSRPLRVLCAWFLIAHQLAYVGIAMFAPATALQAVSGIPIWAILLIQGVVTTIYTTLGGMKAVIWTDVFQGITMIGGTVTVLIIGAVRVGGLGKVWQISYDWGRIINPFDFTPDPTKRLTFWSNVLSGVAMHIQFHGTSQIAIQRYCSLPKQRQASLAALFTLIVFLCLAHVVMLAGLVMFAYFTTEGCDPMRSQEIRSANNLLPLFVTKVMNFPGLPGLFTSVLFSGAISSMSSSLSSLSAVTWKDLLEPNMPKMAESRKAFITKCLVFIYGVLGLGMAFVTSVLPGHIMQVASRVLGSLAAPTSGIFILGALVPCANWIGSMVGGIATFVITMWMNIGSFLTVPHRSFLNSTIENCTYAPNTTAVSIPSDPTDIFWLYRWSYQWPAVVGAFICIVLGTIVSLLTSRCAGSQKIGDMRPDVVIPIADAFCCCCPKSCRKVFWCGIDHDKVVEGVDEKETETPQKQEMTRKTDEWDTTTFPNGHLNASYSPQDYVTKF